MGEEEGQDFTSKKSLLDAVKKSIRYNDGKPLRSFKLIYDAATAELEPTYFWLLDFLQGLSNDGVEKFVDNFSSAPGSGHFAEMGMRATKMQEEGMKIMGLTNQIIRTIISLLYDLREFEIRLGYYDEAKSTDKKARESGQLSLKQIWMDNVDVKKGRGSLNQMTFDLGFATLRDAFMVSDSAEDVDKNEIVNDQVKRILKPRLSEFIKWVDISEKELRKRYEIQRSYLRTEVESLKLYTAWVKPYLRAAEELKMRGFDRDPALVSAFNTTRMELVIMGKAKVNPESAVNSGKLPPGFAGYTMKRDYFSCALVSLDFTGYPRKVTQQHYGFGGKITMSFDCFALNSEELKLIKKELEEQDVDSLLRFSETATKESLKQLRDDINHFLGYNKKDEMKKESGGENPFVALFNLFKFKKKEEPKKKISSLSDIKKDNYVESEVRELAAENAKSALYAIYDIYKKVHGHASPHLPFD